MRETICKLLDISQTSYYRWKEERAIIPMLEKYFTEEELSQFLREGKIDKLEQLNIQNSKMEDFLLKNSLHKIIIKSTLPIDENDNIVVKLLKAILNKNRHYSLLPLQSFLNILTAQTVDSAETFINEVSESGINEDWQKIIVKFCKYELAELEINAIIKNKTNIIDFFANEKLDKNCMLNFS